MKRVRVLLARGLRALAGWVEPEAERPSLYEIYTGERL